jgi:hypothetical protein
VTFALPKVLPPAVMLLAVVVVLASAVEANS